MQYKNVLGLNNEDKIIAYFNSEHFTYYMLKFDEHLVRYGLILVFSNICNYVILCVDSITNISEHIVHKIFTISLIKISYSE